MAQGAAKERRTWIKAFMPLIPTAAILGVRYFLAFLLTVTPPSLQAVKIDPNFYAQSFLWAMTSMATGICMRLFVDQKSLFTGSVGTNPTDWRSFYTFRFERVVSVFGGVGLMLTAAVDTARPGTFRSHGLVFWTVTGIFFVTTAYLLTGWWVFDRAHREKQVRVGLE